MNRVKTCLNEKSREAFAITAFTIVIIHRLELRVKRQELRSQPVRPDSRNDVTLEADHATDLLIPIFSGVDSRILNTHSTGKIWSKRRAVLKLSWPGEISLVS